MDSTNGEFYDRTNGINCWYYFDGRSLRIHVSVINNPIEEQEVFLENLDPATINVILDHLEECRVVRAVLFYNRCQKKFVFGDFSFSYYEITNGVCSD